MTEVRRRPLFDSGLTTRKRQRDRRAPKSDATGKYSVGAVIVICTFQATFAGRCAEIIDLPARSDLILAAHNLILNLPPTSSVTGEVANPWHVNTWGDVKSVYSAKIVVEPVGARGPPEACMSLRVESRGSGDAQLFAPFTLHPGRRYTARVWLKSTAPAIARIGFRNEIPYFSFVAVRTFHLTQEWKQYELDARFPGLVENSASLRIIADTLNVDVLIGGVLLDEIEDNALAPVKNGQPTPKTFFGMLVNRLGAHHVWPQMHPALLRLWDTGTAWLDVNKAPKQFDTHRIAAYMRYAESNGADLMLTLGQTPDWAAAPTATKCTYDSGCAAPISGDVWRRYLETMMSEYAQHIRFWELWNEPDYSGFWAGGPKRLAEMARVLGDLARQRRPRLLVVGPSITVSGGMDFLDRFLNAGGADKIDIVSFHAYFSPSGDGLAEYIDNIRGALKEHGLGDKPLWNTEAAPTCTVDRRSCAEPGLREVDQDSAILKAALIMRAKAVNNFTYYNFEIPTEEARLVDRVDPNQLTLRGRAFVQTTSFLANATIVDSFVYKGVYAVRLQFGNHIKTVLWSNAENRTVRLPVDWRATTGNFWMSTSNKVDPAGTVTLGRRPILIE